MNNNNAQSITSFGHWLRLLLVCTLASGAAADQLEGIVEFTDGTPALATEVNDNNLILSDKS